MTNGRIGWIVQGTGSTTIWIVKASESIIAWIAVIEVALGRVRK